MKRQTRRIALFFGALHVAMGIHVIGLAGAGLVLACVDGLAMLYVTAVLLPSPLCDDADGRHVIFVDGECVFCHRLVRLILELDGGRHFHVAHLQGDLARAARMRHGADPEDVDGIYLLVHEGTERERLLLDGAAGREIWPRVLATAMPLRLVPLAMLDWGYPLFARYRYRLFGKAEACVAPHPSTRARFLDP